MAPRTLEQATASHDNGFNLVRLVCATLVVVFHAFPMNSARPGASDPVSPLLAPHTDLGALAVGVFFLISGIFVSQSWERDPHPGRYTVRRVARIVPGLFVCLLLTTALAVGLFSDTGWRGMLTPAPWRYIFGNTVLHWLHYIIPPEELKLPGVFGGETLNGPLWTLYWEGRMYVVVALVGLSAALPLRTWMRAAALFLLAAANLFPEVLSGYIWELRLWSLFLTGMLLHTLGRDLRIGWRHVACALALAGMNWTRSAALTPSPLTWFGILLVAATLALAAGTARAPFAAHLQRHDYSYGIYIYHWPVLLMLRTAFAPLGHWRLLALGLLVTAVLAVLSWHCVEAPALRAARRWLRRHDGTDGTGRADKAAGPAPVRVRA
jgi:peptidoglycan/LPS O-acetylase OafA/YrhL